MNVIKRNMRVRGPVFTALMLVAIGHASGQAPPAGGAGGFGGPSGPTEVGVITLHIEKMEVTTELPGRVTASQTADVRPQVGGIVKAINFQPGKEVKAGDILFELDDGSAQAQLAVQQAGVQKAEAAQSSAQAKVDRYRQLEQTNNVSQSDLLDAQTALAQAKADVASVQASLKSAELNLALTKLTAPISGVVSTATVTQGALVTAGQATALATVRQLDPIYVDMVDSSANLLKLRGQLSQGGQPQPTAAGRPVGSVQLLLENGQRYDQTGTLTSPDVVVSESTGTFSIRASFPNPQRTLLPGMFVRATVGLGFTQQGFRVPQRAVTFDAAGRPTALFAENGKAVSHVLTTNRNSGNDWIVTAGIEDGAQVIVDGLQKVAAGADVKPIEVTLDKDGVVIDSALAPGSAAPSDATPPSSAPAPAGG